MPDIHHSIAIEAAPDTVVPLVSTADGLRQWWAEDVEAGADGTVTLGFFDRATVYRLQLVDAGATVRWRCETGQEWEGTELVFGLQPRERGLLLDFVHANWRDASPYFTSCNTTWGGLLFRLKSAAEGRPQGPLFLRSSLGY